MTRLHRWIAVAALLTGACDLDIANPNSPPPIGQDPSRSEVAAAVSGILIAARQDLGDWVLDAGIIGREAYRFDGSDPRFVTEFLQGPLDPGSGAFGGDHWFEPYRTIRSVHTLLDVLPTATQLSAEEQSAVQGFAETFLAYGVLMVLDAHTEDSIPLDVDRPLDAEPAPFVSNDSAFTYVANLLEVANTALAAGGDAFPFTLPDGFTGFDTPEGFARFNRALKARVEIYRASLGCGNQCYGAAANAASNAFADTSGAGTLNDGVYMNYGTGPGDDPNVLAQDPQTSDNLVHPSLAADAETQVGGGPDARLLAKTVLRPSRTVSDLTSDRSFINYPSPGSPIPLIRNEELILILAEANLGLNNPANAAAYVNYIRRTSGKLAPIANLDAQSADSILSVILHERQYSLLYEGGHRWVDMRRTGRLGQVPIDRPSDVVHTTFPIPTDEVLPRK